MAVMDLILALPSDNEVLIIILSSFYHHFIIIISSVYQVISTQDGKSLGKVVRSCLVHLREGEVVDKCREVLAILP